MTPRRAFRPGDRPAAELKIAWLRIGREASRRCRCDPCRHRHLVRSTIAALARLIYPAKQRATISDVVSNLRPARRSAAPAAADGVRALERRSDEAAFG